MPAAASLRFDSARNRGARRGEAPTRFRRRRASAPESPSWRQSEGRSGACGPGCAPCKSGSTLKDRRPDASGGRAPRPAPPPGRSPPRTRHVLAESLIADTLPAVCNARTPEPEGTGRTASGAGRLPDRARHRQPLCAKRGGVRRSRFTDRWRRPAPTPGPFRDLPAAPAPVVALARSPRGSVATTAAGAAALTRTQSPPRHWPNAPTGLASSRSCSALACRAMSTTATASSFLAPAAVKRLHGRVRVEGHPWQDITQCWRGRLSSICITPE